MKQLSYDGRFSDGNKRWADGIDVPENISRGIDLNRDYIVSSHPAVLNGFIDMARNEIRTRKLEEMLGVKISISLKIQEGMKQTDIQAPGMQWI